METLKNAVAGIAGIVGLLTGLLTLYAKYLDVKKSAARDERDGFPEPEVMKEPVRPKPVPSQVWVEEDEEPDEPPVRYAPASRNPAAAIRRSREAVKAPAVTLLAAGLFSLFFNLFIAGFGYVDHFVTPITEESKAKRDMADAVRRGEIAPSALRMAETRDGLSEDATVVMTVCVLMSLSVASAAAAWAGYGMLNLKSYWLSVAGSFAIMAGGSLFCMAGIPIGIWCLSVLYKPEVAESFR